MEHDPQFCGAKLCQEWEGDCDSDDECAGSLICGKDNCNQPQHNSWPSDSDCCAKGKSLLNFLLQRGRVNFENSLLYHSQRAPRGLPVPSTTIVYMLSYVMKT